MRERFRVLFSEEALRFIKNLEPKIRNKVMYNIHKAKAVDDIKLLKKLTSEIWEFRTFFNKTHYRLFAFSDKDEVGSFVIATHGMIKKTGKTPLKDIRKQKH